MTKNAIIVDNAVAPQTDLTRGLDRDDAARAQVAVHRGDTELSETTAFDLVLTDLGEHSCGSTACQQPFVREHLQEVIGPLLR